MQHRVLPTTFPGKIHPSPAVPRSRLLLLFLIFYFICCGLGYPILNRIDWRQAPGGLEDVLTYADLVTTTPTPDLNQHMQFRVLVPYLARPIYRIAKNLIGTWDPIMFALLAVNSFFVALTVTVLLMVVYRELGNYAVALGAALIYLLNFAVPNLRLAGLVDAGEGFFLMVLVWSLLREDYWALPIWAVIGATAKESFVLFLVVFTLSWWLCSRKGLRNPSIAAVWMVTFVAGRAGFPDGAPMGNYPRLSLALALRHGSSPELCLCGPFSLIVPGPQPLVHILLAPASIALQVEAVSAQLAPFHRRHCRCRLRRRCLLWRWSGNHRPGFVQHCGTTSLCLGRARAFHPRIICHPLHYPTKSKGAPGLAFETWDPCNRAFGCRKKDATAGQA